MRNLILIVLIFSSQFLNAQEQDTSVLRIKLDSLMALNKTLLSQQDLEGSMNALIKAEEMCISLFGKESGRYADILSNKGVVHYYKGEIPQVEKYWIESMEIRKRIYGRLHEDYASSCNNMGIFYWSNNNLNKALFYFQEAHDIWLETVGEEDPKYAKGLVNLASVNLKLGRLENTANLYLQALAIQEKSLEDNLDAYISTLGNLAVCYDDLGEFDKVEPVTEKLIKLIKEHKGTENDIYATSIINFGLFYLTIGDLIKAEEIILEGNSIYERLHGKESAKYAWGLHNLMIVYKRMEDYVRGEPVGLEAAAIRKRVLGDDHPDYARSLNNLAALYSGMEEFEKEKEYILECKAIWEKTLGKEHPNYAYALDILAGYYLNMEEYEKSEALYLESTNLRKKIFGTNHPDYERNLMSLAQLYTQMGEDEKAKQYFIEAIKIQRSEVIKASQYLSENQLLSYIDYFKIHQNIYLTYADTHNSFAGICYDNSLFYKGFLLNSSKQFSRIAQSDSASNKIYLDLKAANRNLAAEQSKAIDQQQDLEQLEKEVADLQKNLARSAKGTTESLEQYSWTDIQEVLSEDEVAIEFIHYESQNRTEKKPIKYSAIVLADKGEPEFINLCDQDELQALLSSNTTRKSDYVNDLYSLSERGGTRLDSRKKSLYQLVWEPIEEYVKGKKKIFYSSTGLMHRININAISIAEDTIVGDLYNTVQLNSTRSIVTSNGTSNYNNTAYLYGGIQYDFDSLAIYAANEDYLSDPIATRSGFYSDNSNGDSSLSNWNYLKWTKQEVESISSTLIDQGQSAQIFSEFDATEESVYAIDASKSSPRIIHFATHGFFFENPDSKVQSDDEESIFQLSDNPMIRSGLIMAGANHSWSGKSAQPGLQDGILTAYEISQMDFSNTELVVLSACETGLGDIYGDEGVYGLQRAFKIAGVKYLIMSLWQVPDRQTKDFMVSFYKHWLDENRTIRDAFHLTQIEMKERFYDPYNWAGFVLIE